MDSHTMKVMPTSMTVAAFYNAAPLLLTALPLLTGDLSQVAALALINLNNEETTWTIHNNLNKDAVALTC